MTNPATDYSADQRLTPLKERITTSARRAGRKPGDIRLIAVSKTFGADAVEPFLAAGQRIYGENRVQEAADKWPALRQRYLDVELHLVGQLQSNKVEDAVSLFDVIHSLDRASLAEALAKAMAKLNRRVPCFIQVNVGEEPQKGGVPLSELGSLLALTKKLDIPVVGLMAVPPVNLEPAPFFALLRKLAVRHGLDRLSMGMSGDFEAAIEQGATDIRVGSALFGAR